MGDRAIRQTFEKRTMDTTALRIIRDRVFDFTCPIVRPASLAADDEAHCFV